MPKPKITSFLKKVYDNKVEHVGFILNDGSIVEVENTISDPSRGFDVSSEDLKKYEDTMVATWHTHPNGTSNLSALDFETFLSWPDLDHYIYGTDGLTKYVVDGEDVLVA